MTLGSVGREAAAAAGIDDAEAAIGPVVGGLPWVSSLPAAVLACDSVALASLAIERLGAARRGVAPAPVRVDGARVAASFTSERIIRLDDEPPAVWAPLSGFHRAADGWVRTHANYPHHEARLRALLGLSETAGAREAAAAIAERSGVDLETDAAARGAVVGAVRTPAEWAAHPHAAVIAAAPLVDVTHLDDAPTRPLGEAAAALDGVRVLDLTRVLAGPVAARDLALAGADVLRVDAPRLPETDWIHLDTGQGKRSTLLDLASGADRERFEELLRDADVVLTGYRPGALDRYGLAPSDLAQRHPGLVVGQVSAWGQDGPWAARRGFDSIVQAVTGIAVVEGGDGGTPGALPAQALDHATGHLLAASVVAALGRRHDSGGAVVRMSLARVAHALLASGDPVPAAAEVALPWRERALPGPVPLTLRYAPPVLAFSGAPDDYPRVGGRWGADPPVW